MSPARIITYILLVAGGLGAQTAADTAATCGGTYFLKTRASRPTKPGQQNDIDCGQLDWEGKPQPFCRIYGGFTAVADACDASPECTAFNMEGSNMGYLKKGGAAEYTSGFTTFCKAGANDCDGTYSFQRRRSLPNNNIDCNFKDWSGKKQDFCLVNGDLTSVADACNDNSKCKGFDINNDYGGYLKSGTGPVKYTEGFGVFIKK